MSVKYRCDVCNDGQRFDTLEDALSHMDHVHQTPVSRCGITSIGMEPKPDRFTLECGLCYKELGTVMVNSGCPKHSMMPHIVPSKRDDPPPYRIEDTCCGKCPGGTCYVDGRPVNQHPVTPGRPVKP